MGEKTASKEEMRERRSKRRKAKGDPGKGHSRRTRLPSNFSRHAHQKNNFTTITDGHAGVTLLAVCPARADVIACANRPILIHTVSILHSASPIRPLLRSPRRSSSLRTPTSELADQSLCGPLLLVLLRKIKLSHHWLAHQPLRHVLRRNPCRTIINRN